MPDSLTSEIAAALRQREVHFDLCACEHCHVSQLLRRALEALLAAEGRAGQGCKWTIDDWGGDSVWETACGHVFVFNDGGPKENDFTHCGYCGKRIDIEHSSEAVPREEPTRS